LSGNASVVSSRSTTPKRPAGSGETRACWKRQGSSPARSRAVARKLTEASTLWVDRSFSTRGAGPVVTGTLPQGCLIVGDEVVVLPGERRARIRALQALGRPIECAEPGSHVAVNLVSPSRDDMRCGDTLGLRWQWHDVRDIETRCARSRALTAVQLKLGGSRAGSAVCSRYPGGVRGLVVVAVFKTDEAENLGLAGSIPVHLR
jgi:hypothetical protein